MIAYRRAIHLIYGDESVLVRIRRCAGDLAVPIEVEVAPAQHARGGPGESDHSAEKKGCLLWLLLDFRPLKTEYSALGASIVGRFKVADCRGPPL